MIRSHSRPATLLCMLPAFLTAVVLAAIPTVAAKERQAKSDEEPTTTYSGMVDIKAAEFKMGVDEKWFVRTYMKTKRTTHTRLRDKEKDIYWPLLLLETPSHDASVEDYSIALYELTNLQYRTFLDQSCKTSMFTGKNLDSLYAVAKKIYGRTHAWLMASIYWLNQKALDRIESDVLELNKRAVDQLLNQVGVGSWKEVAEPARVAAWGRFTLPENIGLVVYTRIIPPHWKKAQVAKEQENTPVRWVSGLDADAFAEWAGLHIPTEEEWEYAARGPEGWLYPWGNKWDCKTKKTRNLVLWQQTDAAPGGPAHPNQDRPIAVDAIPGGRSPFGLHHMLGNVMEWTSSVPRRYRRSDAVDRDFFGDEVFRVLRSQSWGEGLAFLDMELVIRNTARVLTDPDGGGIHEANRWEGIGFRTAKYPTPARDVLSHRLRALKRTGLLPEVLVLDAKKAYGVELLDLAPPGEEGPGKVFVRGGAKALGVIPVNKVAFATAKAVLEASAKEDGPVTLGFIYWTGDIAVSALEPVEEEKPAEPEDKPEEGGEEKPGEKPEEKPPEKPPVKPAEKPPAKPADEPPEDETPADAPARPEEKQIWLAGDGEGYLLSLVNGRLALCKAGIVGMRLCAFLPRPEGSEDAPVITKVNPKEFRRSAALAEGGSVVKIRLPIPTRSKSAKDVFGFELTLRLRDKLEGDWQATGE